MAMNLRNQGNHKRAGMPRAFLILALSLTFLTAATPRLFADDAKNKIFAERAADAFSRAQALYRAQMNDPVLAWQFASACFGWADWATNKADRAAIARQGIAACQQSLLFTNSAAAHYYLALNMGQLAQAETLSALKLVREMAREFTNAASLDPRFDFAGPPRGLGLLYRDAPGWPMSIGNRRKALEFLENAVTIEPGYPDNILDLAESYANWGDRLNARKQLIVLDALWPKAQTNFVGVAWELNWDDWSKRRDELRKQLYKD